MRTWMELGASYYFSSLTPSVRNIHIYKLRLSEKDFRKHKYFTIRNSLHPTIHLRQQQLTIRALTTFPVTIATTVDCFHCSSHSNPLFIYLPSVAYISKEIQIFSETSFISLLKDNPLYNILLSYIQVKIAYCLIYIYTHPIVLCIQV